MPQPTILSLGASCGWAGAHAVWTGSMRCVSGSRPFGDIHLRAVSGVVGKAVAKFSLLCLGYATADKLIVDGVLHKKTGASAAALGRRANKGTTALRENPDT